MFMGHHDAGQSGRSHLQPSQAALGFANAEAAIQHNRSMGRTGCGGNQQRIAFTATAKAGEFHAQPRISSTTAADYLSCSLNSVNILPAIGDVSGLPSLFRTATRLMSPVPLTETR
jgi:hypothetical protein